MIGKLDFIFKTILGELLGLPRLLILVGRFHMFAHVCAAFSINPHPKTVSVLHKKGIHDNIFWGDFSLDYQFVWLKTIEIRRVGNTSRHRWAETRSLPRSLWMGELIRWVLSLLFFVFSCYCLFLFCVIFVLLLSVLSLYFLCQGDFFALNFYTERLLFANGQPYFEKHRWNFFLLKNMQMLADGRPSF